MPIARALILSWIVRDFPTQERVAAAAVKRAIDPALSAARDLKYSAERKAAVQAMVAAETAGRAAETAAFAADYAVGMASAARSTADTAFLACTAADEIGIADATDLALTADINWLGSSGDWLLATKLLKTPLWRIPVPEDLLIQWTWAKPSLMRENSNWSWWVEWYEGRLSGRPRAFNLPTKYDLEVQHRLISQGDNWWKRDPAKINAQINGWIKELSPSPEPEPEPETDFPEFDPDPQSNAAPIFGEDAKGRLAIDPHARADELLTNDRARQRHAAARRRALAAAERLRGHNQAGYLADYARELYEALTDNIADGDLAETVLLANRIRTSADAHAKAGPKDDLQPFTPDIKRVVDDLVDSANLHIGQQPVLAAMDEALPGPDSGPLATPADIKTIIGDDEQGEAIAPRTRDYIHVVADMAPDVPDPANRQSRRLSELAANMGRYVVELVSKQRAKLALGASGSAIILSGIAADAAAASSVGPLAPIVGIFASSAAIAKLLANMKKHPDEWMNIAGPSPASQGNMRKTLDLIDRLWPSDTGKKDS